MGGRHRAGAATASAPWHGPAAQPELERAAAAGLSVGARKAGLQAPCAPGDQAWLLDIRELVR